MTRVGVVGGGIAGILAALVAAEDGHEVVLFEASDRLGGLLASDVGPAGLPVDRGTHIPRATGDVDVDRHLFPQRIVSSWQRVDPIRPAQVLAGGLCVDGDFPDVRELPDELRERIESEMTALEPPHASPESDADALALQFGVTFRDDVMAPFLRKTFGCSPDDLEPDAHELFTSRVLAFTADETRARKRTSEFDDRRLAFHDRTEGASELAAWYPPEAGVGDWVAGLTASLDDAGVSVRLNSEVRGVTLTDRRLATLSSTSGAEPVDVVSWSVGVHPFLRAAGQRTTGLLAPTLRRVVLDHVLVGGVPSGPHYVTCWDDSVAAFRLTLYDNLREQSTGLVTIETFIGPREHPPPVTRHLEDMIRVGLLPPATKVTGHVRHRVANGFPVPTRGFHALRDQLLARGEAAARNVAFVGRGAGRAFFMHDVLRELPAEVRSAVARAG